MLSEELLKSGDPLLLFPGWLHIDLMKTTIICADIGFIDLPQSTTWLNMLNFPQTF